MKKKNYHSFITPTALENDLPLTEEAIVALDDLKSYVEEAKNLVENAQQFAAELVFVSSLPTDGQFGKLYVEENTSKLYYWNGTSFVPIISTSDVQYNFIIGGDATS